MRTRLFCGTLLSLLVTHAATADDWLHFGGDAGGSHFSGLEQINRANVAQLEMVWSYSTGEVEEFPDRRPMQAFNGTPILLPESAGQSLVLCTAFNRITALNPATGEPRWTYDAEIDHGGDGDKFQCRGIEYWEDTEAASTALCRHRLFMGTKDLRLVVIDATSGKPCDGFGHGGELDLAGEMAGMMPDLKVGYDMQFSAPPVVVGDVVIIGSADNTKFWRADNPSGAVRAFSARTGAPAWSFDPVPRNADDPAAAGWDAQALQETGGANVWSMMSVDEEREMVFLPTATAGPNYYGGNRPGDNRYANSVVALDANTGKVIWHYQIVHHDVWDIDLPAQPMLVDLTYEGRKIPAVIQLTKQGLIFVLHRETGVPVFPVEERPVPTDGVPGEQLSPTQPFPTVPPPLGKIGIAPEDAWGFTAFDRGWCRDAIAGYRQGGLYEPPSLQGTVMMPGMSINNWGGGAFDAERNLLITPITQAPLALKLWVTEDIPPEVMDQPRRGPLGPPTPIAGTDYAYQMIPLLSPLFAPCTAPPWGELAAIDLTDGSTRWRRTLGVMDKMMPVPFPLQWGTPLSGGPTVTAGGLVFIGASADERFRAFDIDTGELLWEAEIPSAAMAVPMTYEVDGKQYVVVAAGGHMFMYFQNISDHIVAFALPGDAQDASD